ncbi:ABC transporter substrate-binding protein [Lachnospiraceae bacterium ZAX-1]
MKKAVSMFLVLALMVASLSACGSATKDSGTEGTSNAGTADETDTDETDAADDAKATDTANAGGDATFYIGGIGPLTGGAAIYGVAVKNGAQIAVDEINAAGGINGTQIAYNFQDDEHDAEKAVNAYNTLKDWGLQILMGTVTSAPCIAVADKTAEDGIFQITPSGSSTDCIINDNVFQVCFTDPNQGLESGKYVGENKLAEKVAVIYDSSDAYSSGIAEAFIAEAGNQPFEVVVSEAFTADSKTDFTVQLQKAKEAGADMVFLPIYYQEAALIIQQANTMGYEPTFCGGDGLDGILSVENFDTALAEELILLTPFIADADDELTKTFVTTYQDTYGEIPNQFAADGYDAIYIIKAAIEEAGATADMSGQDIGTALIDTITKVKVTGLTGEDMTWEAVGTVNKTPHAVKIIDGVYEAM